MTGGRDNDSAGGRKPHVFTVISGLSTGGAELVLLRLLTQLRPQITATVVSLGDEGSVGAPLRGAGVEVVALGMGGNAGVWQAMRRLAALAQKQRPDILQGWMYHGSLAAQWLGRWVRPVPVVWTIRQTLALSQEKWRTRLIISGLAKWSAAAAAIVYNSRDGHEQHTALGFCDERAAVVYQGFDTEMFAPDAGARERVARGLGLSPRGRWIGMAARYHPMKNHAMALRAIARMGPAYEDVQVLFMGAGMDAGNQHLQRQLKELGLGHRVHLLGERGDVACILPALDVAFLSSRTEGLPNALAEAMACGVPCVGTAVGDIPVLLGDTGMTVPADDARGLAAALARMLDMDAEQRHQLGAAARQRVAAYPLARMAQDFLSVYQRLSGTGLSPAAANSLEDGGPRQPARD